MITLVFDKLDLANAFWDVVHSADNVGSVEMEMVVDGKWEVVIKQG